MLVHFRITETLSWSDFHFYAPGLKGPPGASSVWIVCPSVRPSVRPSVSLSVRNSVPLINKVQYLKFGWPYSNQTWTVSSSKGSSHFTDITCPWGVGRGQNVGLRDFCHSLTLLPPGASVFHKHMSSYCGKIRSKLLGQASHSGWLEMYSFYKVQKKKLAGQCWVHLL